MSKIITNVETIVMPFVARKRTENKSVLADIIIKEDTVRYIWITEDFKGKLKPAFCDEEGELGDISESGKTMTPKLYLIKAMALAKAMGRYDLYNKILLKNMVADRPRNYMFQNDDLKPEPISEDKFSKEEYFWKRLGEDDKYRNLLQGHKTQIFKLLIPHVQGHGIGAQPRWSFTAQDTRKTERDVRSYDGKEANYEDETTMSAKDRFKARRAAMRESKDFTFTSKDYGVDIRDIKKGEREFLTHVVAFELIGYIDTYASEEDIKAMENNADIALTDEVLNLIEQKNMFDEETGDLKKAVCIIDAKAMYLDEEVIQNMKSEWYNRKEDDTHPDYNIEERFAPTPVQVAEENTEYGDFEKAEQVADTAPTPEELVSLADIWNG